MHIIPSNSESPRLTRSCTVTYFAGAARSPSSVVPALPVTAPSRHSNRNIRRMTTLSLFTNTGRTDLEITALAR